jgi:hypothetical protein
MNHVTEGFLTTQKIELLRLSASLDRKPSPVKHSIPKIHRIQPTGNGEKAIAMSRSNQTAGIL